MTADLQKGADGLQRCAAQKRNIVIAIGTPIVALFSITIELTRL
jgi:hypothetical protein